MSEIRWEVYSDRIPLTGRPTPIDEVMAPDKATALTRATALHGPRIVVQSVASRKVAAREPAVPTTMPTKREQLEERRKQAEANTVRELERERRRKAQHSANYRRKQKLEQPIGARPGDYQRAKRVTQRDTREQLTEPTTLTEA